jgi:PadR family transcriptional regulator, regulatory protein PadR
MTQATQLVLRTFLGEPGQEMYGLQICSRAGLPSGTIHPILARLEGLGWVESFWEDEGNARAGGRPRRRYYRLTREGAERAAVALHRAAAPVGGIRQMRTRPAGGLA